jgi:Uma2 family endonuclease
VESALYEYLHTSYDPDREYVDGRIIERNLGEKPHSKTQKYCVGFFSALEKTRALYCFPAQRVQVKETRFRVPDLCVYVGGEPVDKIDDYLAFGVPDI